jgi:outer membrane protein assembly factor BamE (lipoprotein component of BamABCDE complex)
MAPFRSAAALLFVAALGLPACAPEVSTHGYRFDEAALAQLEPGRTTRDGTLQLLGSPSSVATFDDRVWYYVSRRSERMSFYQDDVVDQKVMTITFDDRDVIQSIDRQSLEDAKEVALVDRETPTSGSELSILEQFIGNIGRFNPQPEADAP